jgi:hypothetical protein
MARSDRFCIKVALVPVAIYVVGLLALMVARRMMGLDPLPAGWSMFVPATTLIVTCGAIVASTLARIRLRNGSACSSD